MSRRWATWLAAAALLAGSGAVALEIADDPACTVEHCGCEGACDRCHHLCLACKCGSHIIDRGLKCQEFAACEAGCSSAP